MPNEIKQDEKKFYMLVGDQECICTYRMIDNNTIEFPHTYVPVSLRGKGYASKIIQYALNYALERKLLVIPSCWAVAKFIDHHPEYQALKR